jgi:hypothetical protein
LFRRLMLVWRCASAKPDETCSGPPVGRAGDAKHAELDQSIDGTPHGKRLAVDASGDRLQRDRRRVFPASGNLADQESRKADWMWARQSSLATYASHARNRSGSTMTAMSRRRIHEFPVHTGKGHARCPPATFHFFNPAGSKDEPLINLSTIGAVRALAAVIAGRYD